jgi:phosphate transport system permease protein
MLWRVGRRGGSRLSLFGRLGRRGPPPSNGTPRPGSPLKPAGARKPISTPSHRRFAAAVDRVTTVALGACLVLTLVPLFHIFGYITLRGFSSVNGAFFTHGPLDDPPGLGPALVGSAIMVALATVGAVPIGLLGALYLTEYRRSRLVPMVRFIGELLGGVPSVVVGIFAYALLVAPFGFSAWAGAFALGVLMIPIVMRAAEEALNLVPVSLRNASFALGASHAQTVIRVIVPSALPAIITGIFLAIARIAGETAPLLFTAYNSSFWPQSLNRRTPFLTYYIYYYSLDSTNAEEQRQAWAGALVLLALVMVLNVGIRFLTGRRIVSASRAD